MIDESVGSAQLWVLYIMNAENKKHSTLGEEAMCDMSLSRCFLSASLLKVEYHDIFGFPIHDLFRSP